MTPEPRRILIVEDDAAFRATMAEQILSGGEFSTDEAESAAAAEALLAQQRDDEGHVADVTDTKQAVARQGKAKLSPAKAH